MKVIFIINNGTVVKNYFNRKRISKNFFFVSTLENKKNEKKFQKKTFVLKKNNENQQLYKLFKNIKNILYINFSNIIFKGIFYKKFKGRIINFHPSFLPEHKGIKAFDKAYKSDYLSGSTVHFITNKIDEGEIILKDRLFILKNLSYKNNYKKLIQLQQTQLKKLLKMIKNKFLFLKYHNQFKK